MEERFRISVRELVSFSYYEKDILPAADMRLLQLGTAAHKARQAQAEGETERSIKHVFAADAGGVLVYGRMDAFLDGDVPLVEEIKLGTAQTDLLPEHRAQAVCYAAMVAQEKPCELVRVCVTYVNEQGELLRRYEESLSSETLGCEMDALLAPYLAYAVREAEHRARRDESLHVLRFPFDSYRSGQRELAVQVYTAIARRKRLFGSLPTGTGKSVAVLFPALKALGEGKTERLLYLTSRNTARQSPLNALQRMVDQGMHARCTVLTAKDKLCPAPTRCHPDHCSRAKGHYERLPAAVDEVLASGRLIWTDELICQTAERHVLCPFEFALALCTLADVVLMDLNYAFDPFAQVQRLFRRPRGLTLLVDEAHHAVDRVRESLSGEMNGSELVRLRAAFGKAEGRKHPFYRAVTDLIHVLRDLEKERSEPFECTLETLPSNVVPLVQQALALASQNAGRSQEALAVMRACLAFLYAAQHLDEDYAVLLAGHGRERTLALFCLLPGKVIARVTKNVSGTVFFSATLTPLPAMKHLLGGGEEDACFALPSPFPPQNLCVVRKRVSTRYEQRANSADAVAQAIHQTLAQRPGNYIVYFPSYAYLDLVLSHLDVQQLPPLWVQRRDMDAAQREAFLAAFMQQEGRRLGLCVLGGLFSEGVDLPGDRLNGAIIVGVGLPTPSVRLRAVQSCYERHFGDGFAYACRIPAMHKVLQAAGRVIRSQTDKGLVLLLDERYALPEYAALLPAEWRIVEEDILTAIKRLEE